MVVYHLAFHDEFAEGRESVAASERRFADASGDSHRARRESERYFFRAAARRNANCVSPSLSPSLSVGVSSAKQLIAVPLIVVVGLLPCEVSPRNFFRGIRRPRAAIGRRYAAGPSGSSDTGTRGILVG